MLRELRYAPELWGENFATFIASALRQEWKTPQTHKYSTKGTMPYLKVMYVPYSEQSRRVSYRSVSKQSIASLAAASPYLSSYLMGTKYNQGPNQVPTRSQPRCKVMVPLWPIIGSYSLFRAISGGSRHHCMWSWRMQPQAHARVGPSRRQSRLLLSTAPSVSKS